MDVKIKVGKIDSRKYNKKQSENFTHDWNNIVYVEYPNWVKMWIPKYKEAVELIKLLVQTHGSEQFKEDIRKVIK